MITDTEQRILDTERLHFRHAGAKEHHIHTHLGMPATAYYQQLRGLILRDDTYAHAPQLVARLRGKLGTVNRGSL